MEGITALVGLMTDYISIVAAENKGITPSTKERFKCAACMELWIISVMMKIDVAPKDIYYSVTDKFF